VKNEITFKKMLDGSTVVRLRGGRSTQQHRALVTYDRRAQASRTKRDTLEAILERKLEQWHDDDWDWGDDSNKE
jgi:hypothetical protein